MSDVINTIFPVRLAARIPDRERLYQRYHVLHRRRARLARKKKALWGTYFERLTCFGPSRINQVEELIRLIRDETRHFRVFNPMHTTSANLDSLRKRLGAPCLQYVQIIQENRDVLDMHVVYRNHDFTNKAFGNFLGLGQLLKFMADGAGKQTGTLVCHSVHAYVEHKQLIQRLVRT